MTVRAGTLERAPVRGGVIRAARSWVAPVLVVLGLSGIVGVRWAGTRAGLDPLALGLAFGAALVALAWARSAHPAHLPGPPRRTLPAARDIAIGVAVGLGLVALTSLGAAVAGSNLPPGLARPAAPFLPWAAITILVASGEEALLRGRLFDATRRAGGTPAAIALTTVAFALLHVPLYGWHVVPLDLGVGLLFAGLRLSTRGVAAPAAAHAVADLATWWV